MSNIYEILDLRVKRYEQKYGKKPDELPVTLDQWVALAEFLAGGPKQCDKQVRKGWVPKVFNGVPLRLVQKVIDTDKAITVLP